MARKWNTDLSDERIDLVAQVFIKGGYYGDRVEITKLRKGDDHYIKAGRKGGLKRVPKGTAMLSPEERKINASNAAKARWNKVKGN